MYPAQTATTSVRSHTFKPVFFNIGLFVLLAAVSGQRICLGQALPDLAVSTKDWSRSDVTIAPAVARQSEPCRIHVRVHNNGKAGAQNILVKLAVQPPLGLDPWTAEFRIDSVPGQSSTEEMIQFKPQHNGIHTVVVTLDPKDAVRETDEANNTATLTFPVVRREVFILYHGNSRVPLMKMRYQTHLPFDRGDAEERAYWTRRGVMLLLHRMGTPTRSSVATVEQRVAYWAETGQDLLIDELINRKGEEGVLMARAFKAFKEKYPHIRLAVWCAPSPFKSYHQGLGYADAVLPEVYLRHEGQYKDTDWYLADHRKGGFADRTFIALAMDSRQGKDEDGRKCPRWSSDRAETERQIRSLRAARPEMMGVALYGNFAEEDLIAEADDLFYRYWIMPVLTLELARHSGAVTLRNIGAMDARDVVVVGKGGSRDWVKKLLVVEAGESLNLDLSVGDGVRTVRIEPAPALTLLKGVIDVKG